MSSFGDDFYYKEALASSGYTFGFDWGEGGYEWNFTEVWTKDGRVFKLSESGCSCSSFGDSWYNVHDVIGDMEQVYTLPSLADLTPSDWVHWDQTPDQLRESFRKLGLR